MDKEIVLKDLLKLLSYIRVINSIRFVGGLQVKESKLVTRRASI